MAPHHPGQSSFSPTSWVLFLCGVCLGKDVHDSWDPAFLRPSFSQ